MFDAASGKLLESIKGHAGTITALAFTADGKRLATGSGNPSRSPSPGEVRLWDVAARKELAAFTGIRATLMTVAFDPKGQRLAAGDRKGMVRIWDVSQP